MTKIIEINVCSDCPYCSGKGKRFFWCKRLKTNGDGYGIKIIIPDWCPLPDKPTGAKG